MTSQLWVLAVAFLLWSIWPIAELWAGAAAYVAAWLLLQARPRRLEWPTGGLWITVGLVLLAIPVAAMWRARVDFPAEEGLRGLGLHTRDRLRQEASPSIAPPLITTDRPQTFYVTAPSANGLQMVLGEGGPQLDGHAVADGLFVVFYDPRIHGLPTGTDAQQEIFLRTDGAIHSRRMSRVDPEPHPRWFCSDPAAGWAATPSEETDELIVISRDGELRRIDMGDGPADCVFFLDPGSGERRLAVSHRYEDRLLIFDATNFELLTELEIGAFQGRLAVSPDGRRLAVAKSGVEPSMVVVETAGLGETSNPWVEISLEVRPDWIAFVGADRLAVSSAEERTLCRFRQVAEELAEGDTWEEDAHLWLGRPAVTLAPSLDGQRLFVAVTDFRPDGENHRGNHFIQDQILTLDTESWDVIAQRITGRRTEVQTLPGSLDSGVSPMGIQPQADGTLRVAFAGSGEVWRVDEDFARPPEVVAGYELDLVAPHGVADLGQGIWAASSPAGGAVAVYGDDGLLFFHGLSRNDDELASAPEGSVVRQGLVLRRGERAFYETTRSGISCQSCHLHGGTDHSPHDIGQTPLLPTLTVRGLTGTSPYLRDGSFPRVRDLHPGLANSLLRGYRRYVSSRPEDLEAWVESLNRPLHPKHLAIAQGRTPPNPLLQTMRSGLEVFATAGCDVCHTPPAFTHLGGHPARSLFPEYGAKLGPTVFLDTPSLLGIGAKGHWLQDGRADSLEEVLVEHNRSNRHGDTAGLSEQQIRDLAELLDAL